MKVGYIPRMKQVVMDRSKFSCMTFPPINIQSKPLQQIQHVKIVQLQQPYSSASTTGILVRYI